MPSALETLVKILKLEQETGYKNTAVIGGLQSFASHWSSDAHLQAKRPEHHQLVDELVYCLEQYETADETGTRHESVKYMLGRIMGRVPPRARSSYLHVYATRRTRRRAGQTGATSQTGGIRRAQERKTTRTRRVPAAPVRTERPKPAPKVEKEDDEFEEEVEDENLEALDQEDDYQPRVSTTSPVALRPVGPPPRRPRRSPLAAEELTRRLDELHSSVVTLPKVGAKMAEKLNKLGIDTVEDMLFTFPRRYDDYTRMRHPQPPAAGRNRHRRGRSTQRLSNKVGKAGSRFC